MLRIDEDTMSLVAQALERDRGGDKTEGDAWLESLLVERLGADAPSDHVLVSLSPGDPRQLARRIVNRLQREVFALLCGTAPQDVADRAALGLDGAPVVAAVTIALTAGLGVAAAVAAVVAALILRRIVQPTLSELCSHWREQLPAALGTAPTQPADKTR